MAMATIPTPGSELRHVRKTITFTGGAGAGAVGTITVFTITGRVFIERHSEWSVTAPASAGGTAVVDYGFTSATQFWVADAPESYTDSDSYFTEAPDRVININNTNAPFTPDDIVLTVKNEALTSGQLIFDIWYRPITDDGALAGDDIDQDSRTWTWATALSDIAAVPAMTASALSGLNWLFALARNKLTQTSTTQTLKKDDGTTTVGTATVSDDGTTFTRNEWS